MALTFKGWHACVHMRPPPPHPHPTLQCGKQLGNRTVAEAAARMTGQRPKVAGSAFHDPRVPHAAFVIGRACECGDAPTNNLRVPLLRHAPACTLTKWFMPPFQAGVSASALPIRANCAASQKLKAPAQRGRGSAR